MLGKRMIVAPWVVPVGTVIFGLYAIHWVFSGKSEAPWLNEVGNVLIEPLTTWADEK